MILNDDPCYWIANMSWEYFKSDPELETMLRNRLALCRYLAFCNNKA